jgi:putative SOS response-associated peptidase YedK
MCGRYVTISTIEAVEKRFQASASDEVRQRWKPNTNVSHGESAPVIASDNPKEVQMFQFGFTPRWAKKQFYMINARSEGDHNKEDNPAYRGAMGILQKPMFRQSIRDRRCLVIADAFIEGPQQEKLTRPYLVYPSTGDKPFSLAGIWDEWADPTTGEMLRSFAILTTVSNGLMQAIGHHRSPVVLDPDDERDWLNPETPLPDITSLLRPFPDKWMNAHPISPEIRDPRTNGSHLLEPAGPRVFTEFEYSLHQHVEMFGMGESRARRRNEQQGSLF